MSTNVNKTNKMCFARMRPLYSAFWKNFVNKIAGTVEKGTLPQSQTHRKKLEKHDSSAIHGCVHD
jgi:hypothetical protein